MPSDLKTFFDQELKLAKSSMNHSEWIDAWNHLERAHILSQSFAGPHIKIHFWMLYLGWRERNFREVFGQLIRILLAGPGSILGKAPRGNTGRANIGLFQKMDIPKDLKHWF